MSLTKADIIRAVAEGSGFSKIKATETVETLLEIIKGTLESGEDVPISGFGGFRVKEIKERIGRNPAAAESMILPLRKVVTFKSSGN